MDHATDHGRSGAGSTAPEESLLEVLRRRYAQGEISSDQFAEMKRVLGLAAAPEPDGVSAGAWEAEQRG